GNINNDHLQTNQVCTRSRTGNKVRDFREEQMETDLKLLKFLTDNQLTLTQVNGQRKLGPPPGWTGPPPGPKCEIFVGSIPRNYYEPDIVHIFGTVGTIYELRLMMEFSGTNRGYCFIMYTTEEEAARAVKELHHYEIYPGKRLGVVPSANNCRLCINRLPRNLDSKSIIKRIYEMTDDVDKVAVYRNSNGCLCYVLVSYKTHRSAAMARKILVPESMSLFKNCEVNIEWANANMTPSNVYEESGTCDAEGNVEITKTFIEQIKDKKVAGGRINDKRSNAMNNQRTQRSTEPPIQKGRPIKAASFDSSRKSSLDSPNDRHTIEKCQSRSSVCSNCLLVERARKKWKSKADLAFQANDANENLKYSLDHESKMIVAASGPYLSHLSRGKRSRNAKTWNGLLQRRSNETFGSIQYFSRNQTNVHCDLMNNRRAECYSCHRQGSSFNSPRQSLNDFQSVNCWDLGLVENFSRGLNITNENDGKNCVNQEQTVYNSEHVRHLSNNSLHPHPSNETDRQLANYQYNSCCQHFAINAAEQNNRMDYVQYPNQSFMYNLQNVRELPAFRGYFQQQFSSNDVKPAAIGSLTPEFHPTENYYYRKQPNASVSAMPNRCANDHKYFNHHLVVNNSLQRNYDSLLCTTLNFDERFAYENRMNPMNPMKDTTFAENKMQLEEKFRKL
ncbi:unnamed protein product, partial [Heterotrigona itama]